MVYDKIGKDTGEPFDASVHMYMYIHIHLFSVFHILIIL